MSQERYSVERRTRRPTMAPPPDTNAYPLGSADFEHERLLRQAVWVAPHTEHLFSQRGDGPGQRVLELGSGLGDVALIAARLVAGASGEVVASGSSAILARSRGPRRA